MLLASKCRGLESNEHRWAYEAQGEPITPRRLSIYESGECPSMVSGPHGSSHAASAARNGGPQSITTTERTGVCSTISIENLSPWGLVTTCGRPSLSVSRTIIGLLVQCRFGG